MSIGMQMLQDQLKALQAKYDALFKATGRMRHNQKKFFRYHAKSDLDQSKAAERIVDQLLADAAQAKKVEQQKLF